MLQLRNEQKTVKEGEDMEAEIVFLENSVLSTHLKLEELEMI